MAQEILGRTSDLVLRRAPCEVIVDKLSAEAIRGGVEMRVMIIGCGRVGIGSGEPFR